jgi:NhaP-type Na+/H+ or K+/H+ antiporter
MLLVLLGFFLGNIFVYIARKAEDVKLFAGGVFDNLYSFLMGSVYFAMLFSVPISGNVPLFVLVAGIFLYTLYGRFGAEKLKPLKPEDRVVTKWFSGHP